MHLAHKFLLSLALLGPVAGHTQDKAPFNLQELAPGVYAAIDREGRAGANAGIVIGRDAVLVVDSLYKEAASQALLAAVRKLSSLPIRYLVNTHHHIDHVAGNRLFADSGATVVAQRNVAGWIQSENLRLLGGEQASPAAQAQVANLLQPQLSFDRRMSLDLGGRRVELQHQLGHTGGDTVVWVPDAQVMFLGDLLWRRSIPNLIDADLPDWRSTLAALSLQPDTTASCPATAAWPAATICASSRPIWKRWSTPWPPPRVRPKPARPKPWRPSRPATPPGPTSRAWRPPMCATRWRRRPAPSGCRHSAISGASAAAQSPRRAHP